MTFIIYWQKYSCVLWFFGIQYILQEVLRKMKNQSLTDNIFRIQSDDPIILDYTNIFSNDYEKNDKLIYIYFKDKCNKRKRKPWLKNKWNNKKQLKQETIYDLMIWLFDDLMSENCKKNVWSFKLLWTLSYFCLCCHGLCLNL